MRALYQRDYVLNKEPNRYHLNKTFKLPLVFEFTNKKFKKLISYHNLKANKLNYLESL